MIDKKHDPDESEITKSIDALESDGSAAEGERDPSGTDKLIKIKSTESYFDEESDADDELEDEDESDSVDYADDGELSSDERLAALIYDDEDDDVQLKSDIATPTIDIFSIGNLIPKINREEGAESTVESDTEATEEQTEDAVEEQDLTDEPIAVSDEAAETPADDEAEESESVEPAQIEFDINTPESAVEDKEDADIELEMATETVPDNKAGKKYDPENPRFIDTVFSWLELLLFTLVAVMVLTSFVFKLSVVEGGSMDKTLYGGERLIIYSLFYEPERFDIVVCEDYSTRLKKPIVKRVIALPGEHLVITADGTVTVDGVELDESDYVYINQSDYLYNPVDIVIPEGKVFVMGDHRNISDDSRSEGVGPIDIDSILGKVVLRIYPFDRFGAVD